MRLRFSNLQNAAPLFPLERVPLSTPLLLAACVLSSIIDTCNAASVVNTGININPINQIPGIGNLFGDDDTEITDKWWFWLIIGLISAFMVVLTAFGIRGCLRYRRWKREKQSTEATTSGPGPPPSDAITTDIELGRRVSVEPVNGKVVSADKLERSNSADF